MVTRYAVKTTNSYYLIEHHGGNIWFLCSPEAEGKISKIKGIFVSGGKDILPVPKDIEGFKGFSILVDMSSGDRVDQFSTTEITEVLIFQNW